MKNYNFVNKINYLFIINITTICTSQTFLQFQNDKINHIGEILVNIKENNIESIIEILKQKRTNYEKNLNTYNEKISKILKKEVTNWSTKLEKIHLFYKDYINTKITEKDFLENSINIVLTSLQNIKISLIENNINNEYTLLLEQLTTIILCIKNDKNLSIENLIIIANLFGNILLSLNINNTSGNFIKDLIKIINHMDFSQLNLSHIYNILLLIENITVILNKDLLTISK
jgi:hypothetical protein